LLELGLGVNDDGAIPGDRLLQGFAGDQEEANALSAAIEQDEEKEKGQADKNDRPRPRGFPPRRRLPSVSLVLSPACVPAPSIGRREGKKTWSSISRRRLPPAFAKPDGVAPERRERGHNPVGVETPYARFPRVARRLATLGWRTQSLWD
jgi:hypothetical protein